MSTLRWLEWYVLFTGNANQIGALKKVGALKIIHEKFKKKNTDEEKNFKDSFKVSLEMDPALKQHVSKAQEDLNPLKVLRIFKRTSEYELLFSMKTRRGLPNAYCLVCKAMFLVVDLMECWMIYFIKNILSFHRSIIFI